MKWIPLKERLTFAELEASGILSISNIASTGEPKERNPKLLPVGDGFGFLLFFGDLS